MTFSHDNGSVMFVVTRAGPKFERDEGDENEDLIVDVHIASELPALLIKPTGQAAPHP